MKMLRGRIRSSTLKEYADTGFLELLLITSKYKFKDWCIRWIWFFIRPLILQFSRHSELIDADNAKLLKKYYLTLGQSNQALSMGVNVSAKLRDTLEYLFSKEEITEVYEINQDLLGIGKLIIFDPMFAREVLREKSLFAIFLLALRMRMNKTKLWAFPVDPCDLGFLSRFSILVSLAGGAIICQSNTREQMKKYGAPHAVGPYIWIATNPIESNEIFAINSKEKNKNVVVIAKSGDKRREQIAPKLKRFFEDYYGFEVFQTNHQYPWHQYVDLMKSAVVITTTSYLQFSHSRKRWMFGNKLPDTVMTARVIEGLLAGAAVVTTRDACLEDMGFERGVDFIEIGKFEDPLDELRNYDIDDFHRIGINGQKKLKTVLCRQLIA